MSAAAQANETTSADNTPITMKCTIALRSGQRGHDPGSEPGETADGDG
jgi:hypothetical protein